MITFHVMHHCVINNKKCQFGAAGCSMYKYMQVLGKVVAVFHVTVAGK